MKLYELAHSRTGDKGNISNVSLIAYEPKDFERLKEKVTALFINAIIPAYPLLMASSSIIRRFPSESIITMPQVVAMQIVPF